MKKIFPLFFALLLAVNSFGLLFFYGGGILICKIQASKEIISSKFSSSKTLIKFSSKHKNLEVLDEKEIIVNGKMFDIVKTETHGDELIYFAYSDEQEDNYLKGVSQFEKNNSKNNSLPTKNSTHEVLKYISDNENFDLNSILSNHLLFSDKLLSIEFFYQSPFGNIFSPPPEIFIS